MKRNLILFLILMMTFTLAAQKKTKIKGNKVVTDIYQSLEDFHSIEISDGLVVDIMQAEKNGYHLKTDENLVDSILFEIENGVLKIGTINKIISSKILEIDLTFDDVEFITLYDDSKMNSMNRLNFTNITFNAYDDSKYKLDLKVDDGTFKMDNSASGEILLRGENASMFLDGNAYLKGDILLDNLQIEVNKRADMNLKGDVEKLMLTATGSTDIKAKKLKTTFTQLIASNSSDLYIYASKELKIYAQGTSYIYVYGNPDIIVDGLTDKSQIIKK